jgi:uncharacterized protein YegJ (DUF2314 family)
VMVPDSDPDMAAAIAKAQASLDKFLAIAEKPPEDSDNIALKVRITDANGSEHFWVSPFRRKGDGFVGTISNDPAVVKSVTFGQEIEFARKDVTDWMYMTGGKIHGGFTIRALLPHMSEEETGQYEGLLAPEEP